MVNLTAAERVYEYWIDKASSAADLVLKIVFAVILFLVARKLILWLCGLIRKNMRRFHTEEAVVSFTVSMVKYSLNTLLVLTIIVQLGIVSEASIAAAIASAGVAVSLALQGGLSNFAGGVMILLLKPFKVGDYIIFPGEGQEGTVRYPMPDRFLHLWHLLYPISYYLLGFLQTKMLSAEQIRSFLG